MKDIKFNKNVLLYFNLDGDLVLDKSEKGNHPIKISLEKLCWFACLKAMRDDSRKAMKDKKALLDVITSYLRTH